MGTSPPSIQSSGLQGTDSSNDIVFELTVSPALRCADLQQLISVMNFSGAIP